MIAHLIGGPYHGTDLQIDDGQHAIYIAEQTPSTESYSRGKIPVEQINFREGVYRQVVHPPRNRDGGRALGKMQLFVFEELPHQFVITVDAVPGADPALVRQVVEDTVAHVGFHQEAFIGGIRGAKVN